MVQIEVFEDALSYSGWGLYSKFLVLAFGICSLSHGLASVCVSFALPLATCDIAFDESEASMVQIALIAGQAFGGYILNAGSDVFGRKCLISNSLIMIFGGSFTSAFAHGIPLICVASFCLGSGLEALIVCTKIHLAEILPVRKRGHCLVLMDIFWTVGYLMMTGVAYGMTRIAVVEHQVMDLRISAWRLIFSIAGGLNVTAACLTALIEGSPRYFLFKKRNDYAAAVIKQLYTINNSRSDGGFEIKQVDLDNVIKNYGMQIRTHNPSGWKYFIMFFMNRIFKASKLLLSKRFFCCILALIILRVSMFVGINGMNIWLARSIYYLDTKSCTAQNMDFQYLMNITYKNCNITTNHRLYKSHFMVGGNIIAGQLITLFAIEYVPRRISIFICMSLCGLLFHGLAFLSHDRLLVRILFSTSLMAAFSSAYTTMSIITVEAFPTCLRGTANAQVHFIAFLLSCFLLKFVTLSCRTFEIVMGSVLLGASVVSYFVPDMRRLPMVE